MEIHGAALTPTSFLKYDEWLDLSLGPPDWLVQGLLERGSGGFIHGQPGSFKSFLLLQLGLDIAAGQAPLTIWQAAPPKPVLLMQAEGTRRAWRDRIRAQGHPRGVPFISEHRLDLKVDSRAGRREMWTALERHHPALVIIDPLKNLMSGTDGDPIAIERWITLWNDWRQHFGCAVLIGQHDRQAQHYYDKAKGKLATSSFGVEELRGRTELIGWADLIVALKKRDNVATLTIEKVRDVPVGAEYQFRLEHQRLVLVGRSDTVVEWLLDRLGDEQHQSEVVKQCQAETGASERTVRRHIVEMLSDGLLEQRMEGHKFKLRKV